MSAKSSSLGTSLPPYSLRESQRARQVRLKISPYKGLEIIVPSGFDQNLLPRILCRHRAWIEDKLDEFALQERPALSIPERIHLPAVAEEWSVMMAKGSQPHLSEEGNRQLRLTGVAGDLNGTRTLLRHWLMIKAERELVPRLHALGRETGLSFSALTIRGQKSRWGSCSSQNRISLNFKLLFLPQTLVRHVLIHELCHTVHLNHSQRFWDLVERFDPDCRQLRQELRDAWRHIPDWLES